MNKLYILEGCIYFDEHTMALSLDGEQENTIVLPAPSARLLSELIKTNGTMVTREELLVRVWGNYGYRASNSNLNNYLSILRRSLTSLLPQTILITTLPKKGIIFQANIEEVSVRAHQEKVTDSSVICELEALELASEPKAGVDLRPEWRKIIPKFILSGSAGVLFLALIFLFFRTSLPIMSERHLFTLSQCRFYLIQDTPLSQNEVLSIMDEYDISLNCDSYPRDVFVTHYDETGKRRVMTFFAWCQRSGNGKYTRCENIKKASWRRV